MRDTRDTPSAECFRLWFVHRAARPETDRLSSGLALQFSKFYKVAKLEASVSVGVALADELAIEHRAVVKIGVGEGAAVVVFVLALDVYFVHYQSDSFPFNGIAGELFGFFAETADRLFRMHRFRCVDADETHFFVGADDDCVAIDDTDDLSKFTGCWSGFFKLRWSANDS